MGKNLKRLRKKEGLSQAKLAELIHRSQNYITFVENGKCGISSKTLANLRNAFGVGPAQFYTTESSLSNLKDEFFSECLNEFLDEYHNKFKKDLYEFLSDRLSLIVKEEEEKRGKGEDE